MPAAKAGTMNRLAKPERPEFLLDLGHYIRRQQRAGVAVESLAWRWGVSAELLRLAVAFTRTSDGVKFRALVEDWSLERIAEAVRHPEPSLAVRVTASRP
jgi:hypothetical protein